MSRYTPLAPGDHERIVGPLGLLLRPINASDIPNVFRWRHDPEVIQWWGDPPESEAESAEEELETDVNPCWRFIICEDGRDVGYIQYWHQYADTDYDWSAGIDIYIGEPDARDRGLGPEAVRTMLDYLFEVKHLHRVTIDPDVRNARAIRAYEKSGFRIDGILCHNERRDDGTYADTQYLSLLEEEWPEVKARWLSS